MKTHMCYGCYTLYSLQSIVPADMQCLSFAKFNAWYMGELPISFCHRLKFISMKVVSLRAIFPTSINSLFINDKSTTKIKITALPPALIPKSFLHWEPLEFHHNFFNFFIFSPSFYKIIPQVYHWWYAVCCMKFIENAAWGIRYAAIVIYIDSALRKNSFTDAVWLALLAVYQTNENI